MQRIERIMSLKSLSLLCPSLPNPNHATRSNLARATTCFPHVRSPLQLTRQHGFVINAGLNSQPQQPQPNRPSTAREKWRNPSTPGSFATSSSMFCAADGPAKVIYVVSGFDYLYCLVTEKI